MLRVGSRRPGEEGTREMEASVTTVLVTPDCKARHMRCCQEAEEYGGRGLIPSLTWFGRDAGLTAEGGGGGCVHFNVFAGPQN